MAVTRRGLQSSSQGGDIGCRGGAVTGRHRSDHLERADEQRHARQAHADGKDGGGSPVPSSEPAEPVA